jgi:uncharacterized protein YukE
MSNMEAFNKIMSEIGKQLNEDTITVIKAALEAPQRTWVGLTADEYVELAEEYGPFPINQIEAKLKEKNT